MTVDLPGLAAALRAVRPEEFGPSRLNPLLEGILLDPASVAPYVRFKEGAYTRSLVYADERFELMVLSWEAGSASTIHDHMGQQCWFVAHSGSFEIENYRLVAGGGRPGYARVDKLNTEAGVTAGMPDYRGLDNEIHRVCVPKSAGRAVSVHVYAQPIRHCLIFDAGRQRCVEKALTFDYCP